MNRQEKLQRFARLSGAIFNARTASVFPWNGHTPDGFERFPYESSLLAALDRWCEEFGALGRELWGQPEETEEAAAPHASCPGCSSCVEAAAGDWLEAVAVAEDATKAVTAAAREYNRRLEGMQAARRERMERGR